MSNAIETDGLTKRFGQTQALAGVDLQIRQGSVYGLLGPNGAGKTTLVMHLNGIHATQHGSVAIGGLPVVKEHLREIRRRVGIVFQDPDDQLFMPTVRDDVAFGPANLGVKGEALRRRVVEALDRVGMVDFIEAEASRIRTRKRPRCSVPK